MLEPETEWSGGSAREDGEKSGSLALVHKVNLYPLFEPQFPEICREGREESEL